MLRKDQAQSFTDYLNTVDEDIKWTTEGEVLKEVEVEGMENRMERGLAFLDTLSVINEDGTIKTRVYRKETHTDQYLNFQSNHPLEHKIGVVKTLAYRAKTVVSEREDRRKELEHLRGALKCKGYPDWILRELKEDNSDEREVKTPEPVKETSDKERNKKTPVVIPYIKGFSEQIRLVLGKYGIPTYFKPTNTLRQLLVKPKDPVDKENVVGPVYKIKCEECEATYVGETESSLKARFSEYRRPSSTTSEVAKHIHKDQPEHTVELDNTEILTTVPRWFERGVKEAIYIRALNPSLNRDGGRYNLLPVWDNMMKKRVKAERPRRRGGLVTIVTHNVP